MTEEHNAILHDYENTVNELRDVITRLTVYMDVLVDWCDGLRTANNTIASQERSTRENSVYLLQTIDILRSENERLKIALQTGEE
jgi:hypothetical protein